MSSLHDVWCRPTWWWRGRNVPRWREDQVADMLDIARYGCERCGSGAIRERDAVREARIERFVRLTADLDEELKRLSRGGDRDVGSD